MMRAITFVLIVASLSSLVTAIGPGRLIINTPTNVESCGSTTVRWYWTGSASDAATNTVTVGVVSLGGSSDISRRSASDRLVKRRLPPHGVQKRDGPVTIHIGGGSGIAMDDFIWTWNSIALSTGTYRMSVSIDNVGLTSYSDDFTITEGSDISCLSSAAASTTTSASSSSSSTPVSSTMSSTVSSTPVSTTQDTESTSAAPSTTSSADPNTTSTAQNSDTTGTDSSNGTDNSAGTFNSASSKSTEGSHSNGGKIAAAILVPIAVIGALALLFFCCRKRNSEEAADRRRDWSEKAFGRFPRSQSTTSSFAGIHRRNASNVSGQSYAMQDAAPSPNTEMTEAGMAGQGAGYGHGVFATEHHDPAWVNFDGEHDAHPLSPRGMQDIVRRSTEQSRQPIDDYHHYPHFNHVMESSYPPFVPSRPAPQPQPQQLNGAQSQTSEVMLQRNGSESSQDVTQTTNGEDLGRKNSSVRRKPVPVISVVEDRLSSRKEEASPFGDEHAAQDGAHGMPFEVTTPTVPQDAAREAQASPTGSSGSRKAVHPTSVGQRPSLAPAPFDGPATSRQAGLPLPGRSLTGPRSVAGSEYGSPAFDENRPDPWKLSVQLGGDQDRGFRVSFPEVQNQGPHAL